MAFKLLLERGDWILWVSLYICVLLPFCSVAAKQLLPELRNVLVCSQTANTEPGICQGLV